MTDVKSLILDMIEYREVPGYAGFFSSQEGKVVREDGRVPSVYYSSEGRAVIRAYPGHLHIHRAVALAWIDNPRNVSDVNHIDGDKTNNHVTNLEWCTRTENLIHAMRTGLHANPEKAVVGWNPKTGEGVWFISTAEAGRHGFTQPNVVHCLKGNRSKCKGFIWEYAV